MKKIPRFTTFLVVFSFLLVFSLQADEPLRTEHRNISYYPDAVLEKSDEYRKTQCRLDISAPKDAENLPVLVWFHGGGLSGGSREIPALLKKEKIVLVGVGYRLFPKAKYPDFIEDAAASVAWTFANIEQYGGNSENVFVGGYSAGGYLAGMVGLDPRWLKPYGIEPKRIAGLVILSGQVSTHFNVRKNMNYSQPEYATIIDEKAPMFYLSKDAPPIQLLLGDRKIEWPTRVEENQWMAAALRAMKHPHVEFYEHAGYDHGKMGNCPEAFARIRRFVTKEELPYFSSAPEDGRKLDILFQAADKDSRPDDEILETVRLGLLTARSNKMPILRWIGNKYIWGKNPQNPEAIALMVEASRLSDPEIYYPAIYFGLSTTLEKTPEVLQAMIDVAMKTEDYYNTTGRIEWGCNAPADKAALIKLLDPYLESTDEKTRNKAENVRSFLNDKQAWLKKATEERLRKAKEAYGPRLNEFKDRLLNGNSASRLETFQEMDENNVWLIVDDSFKDAFEACLKDTEPKVRRELASSVGNFMIWSVEKQSDMAIALLNGMLKDEDRDVRYKAVYFGLSTVRSRSEEQVTKLLELIVDDREPNLLRRIVWGLDRDKETVKAVLQRWKTDETDPDRLKKIDELDSLMFPKNGHRK